MHKIVWQPKGHFLTMVQGQREYTLSRKTWLPAPLSWAATLALDPFVPMGDKHSTAIAMIHMMTFDSDKILELDNESAADFLRRLGVSETYVHHYWAFVSKAILNVPIEEVSAAAFVRCAVFLSCSNDMEMGFCDGGLGDLFKPARDLLASMSNSSVRTSTEVTSFLKETLPNGGTRCTGVVLDDGTHLTARYGVISTLPPHTLLPLLPEEWTTGRPEFTQFAHALGMLKPCPYLCVYIWFDRKVTNGRQMWARIGSEKTDLCCEFYDYSNIYTGLDAHGVPWCDRNSFIGANIIDCAKWAHLTDNEVVDGTLRELREFFGDNVANAKVVHSMVNRVPMAIFRSVVGTESLRPSQQSPIDGLFLGGCWTDTKFGGSMEGAALGGNLAADKLLAANKSALEKDIILEKGPAALPLTSLDFPIKILAKMDTLRPWFMAPLFKGIIWMSGGTTTPQQIQSKL
eukprot:GEMP01018389.1.p1 GENE.GEMP01018389.1~~GEMP01018389.1.p1  ORF type:complete len:459 (+),score=106.66 GEMP01018389.1:317-1693(+)